MSEKLITVFQKLKTLPTQTKTETVT